MRKWLMMMFLTVATAANAATLTEKVDQTVNAKPGSNFVLSNVNGGVTVHSWDQARVRVVAEKRVKADSDADAAAAMKKLRVNISSRDNGITVETIHPNQNNGGWRLFDWLTGDSVEASVRYEIYLPRTMNLDVQTVNGAVSARDLHGKLEVETVNGAVEIKNCGGALDAATVNGAIRAEMTSVTKNATISLATTNGRIVLHVPPTLTANVDVDTLNGGIETDLPVATTSVSRNSLRGKINGGGGDLKLSTTNGSIEIRTNKTVASK